MQKQKGLVLNSGELRSINISFISRRAVKSIDRKVRDYNYPRCLFRVHEPDFLPGYIAVFISVEDSELIFVKE